MRCSSPCAQRHDRAGVWLLIKRRARLAESRARCRAPRATIRPHLLNHGADLRCADAARHSYISTKQIYPQVARERLKQLHAHIIRAV